MTVDTPIDDPDAERLAEAPVSTVLDEVAAAVSGEDMSVHALFEALGAASYTPLMMAPALAVVSPLSGIPGFSSL